MAIDKARIAGLVGFWAFIAGLVISLVAGLLIPANGVVILILVILGIVIGFLNITPKETQSLLLAAIALIVVGNAFAALTLLNIDKYIGSDCVS